MYFNITALKSTLGGYFFLPYQESRVFATLTGNHYGLLAQLITAVLKEGKGGESKKVFRLASVLILDSSADECDVIFTEKNNE